MRILLVDDDQSVIQSLLAVLRSLPGHEVRVALNGEKALEHASTLGGVDLLIADVVMEPMDGFTVRDHVLAANPQLRTIFISGYDLSDYTAQIAGSSVLNKPVDPGALTALVRQHASPSAPRTPSGIIAQPRVGATPAQPRAVPASPTATGAVAAAQPEISHSEPIAEAAPPTELWVADPTDIGAPTDAELDPAEAGPALEPISAGLAPDAAGDQGEDLIGHTIGGYQILSHLGQGRWGTVYAAVQISINRPVGLKLLSASRQHDETAKARFIADARAKAHVQHPAILSVYEAGESNGRIFYAHEYVDGQNLQELQASGQKIEESTALKILRVIGEGLAYFHAQNIPHSPLSPSKIYLGVDGQPRLANLATQFSEAYVSPESELQILGRAMLGVLPAAQNLSPGIRALLGRLVQSGPNAFATVAPLLQAVKALEPKVVPVEAAKISAQDRAAVAAVEAARKQQRKSFWLTVGSMAATFLLVAGVVYFYVFRSNERSLSQQVAIPAGQYLVGGKKVAVQPFWIDKYEVTIGQYAVFLKYLNENPTAEAEFNHPRQPRHIEHKSPNWEIYYLNAVAGRAAHQTPIDLNAPMLDVTWWSAYAYAKWRGRELPTEAEWEAAARGAEGFAYPWGNDYDPKKVNSGADHQPNDPGAKGTVDKYNFWSPVDKIKGDVSPFGVVGMGGNVSEWVDTWETLPDGRVVPVLKGGNFTSPEGEMRLDRRVTERDPSRGEEFIGFRTISRTPPQ